MNEFNSDRRDVLKQVALISGGVVLAPSIVLAQNAKKGQKITVLHTNDTHSNIDPFPPNHAKYPGQGGVVRRFELIKKIRTEEEHVLLLDAGDIFQGTPYFNRYGGVVEMKVMSEMGYDAATMGNHDFDGGIDGFIKAKSFANFPFLCANYDFTNTALDGLTRPRRIIQKGKIKVGIFGVGVELDGLVPKDKYLETKYIDPVEIANEQALKLKEEGCDLIICLSHLGYSYDSEKISDLKLGEQTENIHLIIGGHTHTFLSEPTVVSNRAGHSVLINQVGWAGVQLGRVDFQFEKGMGAKSEVLIVD